MENNFKNIHIGKLIKLRVQELSVSIERISSFMKISENDINLTYEKESLDTNILLRWSKLLEYDFFRLYCHHLILYSPQGKQLIKKENSTLPQFRKSIYTREIIDFILDQETSGRMTKLEIIDQYGIPKTTLYKWISKYKK